jgi:hypothetical protein
MSKFDVILLRFAVFNLHKINTAFFVMLEVIMTKKKYKTQFSIYKVDYDRAKKYF